MGKHRAPAVRKVFDRVDEFDRLDLDVTVRKRLRHFPEPLAQTRGQCSSRGGLDCSEVRQTRRAGRRSARPAVFNPRIAPTQQCGGGAQFIGLEAALVETGARSASSEARPPLHKPLGLGYRYARQTELNLQEREKAQRTDRGFAEGVARVPPPFAIERQAKAYPLHRVVIPCSFAANKNIRFSRQDMTG